MRRSLWVRAGMLILLVALAAVAQLNRGALTGTVADRSGAVVPGVKITIVNTATKAVYETTTNEVGQYTRPNLPVGPYQVTFESPSFKKFVRGNIDLGVTQVLRIDATLEVGSVAESVVVTAEVPRVQTDSPEVGTDLSHQNLVDLPLSFGGKRTAEDFAYKLTPGVTGDNWKGHVNGSTDFSHESILDGASATSNRGGNFEGGPSVEAMQEFKVQTSGISAEFGRVQTGVFNYVMKSGTNQIHGSAYGEFRNDALNANTFVNNFRGDPKDKDSKQNYAFSFGGPVYIPKVFNGKNKTFFYVAYERFRVRENGYGAPSVTAPLPEFYQGDFSRLLDPTTTVGTDALGRAVPKGAIYDPATFRQVDGRWVGDMFPGNRIPLSRISATSQHINQIATAHYLPTIKDATGQIALENNMAYPVSGEPINDQHQFSLKMDQNISDAHKLSGSFSQGSNPRMDLNGGLWDPTASDGGPFSKAQDLQQIHRFYRVSEDYTISPTVMNHVTLSANRFTNQVYSMHQPVNGAKELGIQGLNTMGYPVISWGGGPYVQLANPGDTQNTFIAYNQYGLLDTVSFSKGRHFIKAGFDFRRNQMNYRLSQGGGISFNAVATAIPNETYSGNKTGYAFASYLLGIVNSASLDDPRPTGDRRHYMAAFVQDDFKVSSRLTLNLGLRWDFQPPGTEVNNLLASWSPNERDPKSGLMGAYQFAGNCDMCTGRNYFGSVSYRDWGPRIGFAYRLGDKWTVRGGYGIYYEGDFFGGESTTFLGKATSNQAGGTWSLNGDPVEPWKGLYQWDNNWPSNRYSPPVYNRSWGDSNTPGMIDPNYGRTPYIQAWNFNIQREIAKRTTLDIAYVGNKGTGLRSGNLSVVNQLPLSLVQQYGKALTNPIRSAADAAANGIAYPYPGFTGTVASALRQYPQVRGNDTIWDFGAPLGFSTYNALQVTVNKEFSHGLSVYGNYVWSKNLSNVKSSAANDNGGTPADYYNLKLEKSLSPYDTPHMFKAYFDYELPFGRGKMLLGNSGRFVNALLGGWAVSGIVNYFSGNPIGFPAQTWPIGWNGNTDRANVAPGNLRASGYSKSAFDFANIKDPSNRYINTSLISDPDALHIGTSAPRYGQLRTFGTINEDFGIHKSAKIGENYRLQLRAEFLNAFNRHQLGGINTKMWSSLFGQVTDVTGNRQVQIGARLDF